MSFSLVAANPCIFQGTLWVCYFLDWIWFNCSELYHRVKILPSVTLEDTQIWPAVMKSLLGLPLGSCSSKGSSCFLPLTVLNQALLEVCSQQHLELTPQFRFSSVITCAMVFLPQENQNIFPLRTRYRYSAWPALLRSAVTLSYLHSWTRIKAVNSFQSRPNLS